MIPNWMREQDTGPRQFPQKSHGKKGFVGKTIDGIFAFMEEAFVSEASSRLPGILQSLDPRAKLISILAVLFATSLIGDLRVLAFIYLLTLVFAHASKIDLVFFIKRVWLFIPLFAGIIAMPMILNIFIPGDPLIHLASLAPGAHLGPFSLPESIYVTRQGAMAAAIFTMRVAACVSAVVLLFITTPKQVLFRSLRAVGVPKLYVLTVEMAYRYIFLLMELVREMYIAKKARTIRARGLLDEQRWVAGRMGYALIRSLDMSEKVHMAMISRGFTGEVHIMEQFKLRPRDYIAGATAISLSIVLVLISQNIIRV